MIGWALLNWGLFESRLALSGIPDPRALGARKFVNLILGVLAHGVPATDLHLLDEWLTEPEPELTPEQLQEKLRPTWGMTPDAIAGQDAMMALVGGG